MAESVTNLSGDFTKLVNTLVEYSRGLYEYNVTWFRPEGVTSVVDPNGIVTGFDKTDIQRQSEVLFSKSGGVEQGNSGDLVVLSLSSDFISQAERAYLERCKTYPRSQAHFYSAQKSAISDEGVLQNGFRKFLEDLDKSIKIGR